MTTQKIIRALRRLQVETGSLACLGCGHENSCSTKGCAILRQAAEELEQQGMELEGMRSAANSLKMHLEKVTAERDAAVDQLSELECCEFCKHTGCIPRGGIGKCEWEWHGPQKEE